MTNPDVFGHVATRQLTRKDRARIRRLYRAGRFDLVFPAGSAAQPALLVGRTPQMAQLSALANELFDPPDVPRSKFGVVLHGPRGTGKTALLDAFAKGVARAKSRIIQLTGAALSSPERFIHSLMMSLPPAPEHSTGTRSVDEVKGGAGVLGGRMRREVESHTHTHGERPEKAAIEAAIRHLANSDQSAPASLALTFDEAHQADPAALGELLNAVQSLAGGANALPVALVLAGTPDLLDVLGDPDCEASWFLDRAADANRLAPVPNDLSPGDCALALAEPLAAAGVGFDSSLLRQAAEACKGSPSFTQVLGLAALTSAARNRDFADFSPDGEILAELSANAEARYRTAWADLDRQGLTGCARQLGALWRSKGTEGTYGKITKPLVDRAIGSGLDHAPEGTAPKAPMDAHGAQGHFKHLGLLWSVTGHAEGPWSLGLPSFFDHAEAVFHDPDFPAHHAALPALETDMKNLLRPPPGLEAAEGSDDAGAVPVPGD